jgi:hypothetical protein
MCDIAHATKYARPPAMNLEKAAAYIMPETFSVILTMLNIQEPEFGAPDLVQKYGASFFDHIFATYYLTFGFDVTWSTRPGGNGIANGLPLITRKGVHLWLRKYIKAGSEAFWERLNNVLRDIPELVDPITEEAFVHKTIPRSCFPEHPDDAADTFIMNAYAQYTEASDQITANANQCKRQI